MQISASDIREGQMYTFKFQCDGHQYQHSVMLFDPSDAQRYKSLLEHRGLAHVRIAPTQAELEFRIKTLQALEQIAETYLDFSNARKARRAYTHLLKELRDEF